MSNYTGFETKVRDLVSGEIAMLPNQTVHVYDVTHSVMLADVTSDDGGIVVDGTVPVTVGTRVRFGYMLPDLRCAYGEQVTT